LELKDFIKDAIKDTSETISKRNSDLNQIDSIVNPKGKAMGKREIVIYN
jgi:predicted nucleic-acid-binding protein